MKLNIIFHDMELNISIFIIYMKILTSSNLRKSAEN